MPCIARYAPEEVQAEAAAYRNIIATRKPVEQLEVEGKLLWASKIPTVKEIQPYTQGLAVFEYEVEKVLSGKYASKTVRVAHWVILDREWQRIAQSPKGARGTSCWRTWPAIRNSPATT